MRFEQVRQFHAVLRDGRRLMVWQERARCWRASVDGADGPYTYRAQYRAEAAALHFVKFAVWLNPAEKVERQTVIRCRQGHEWTVRFKQRRDMGSALLPARFTPQVCPTCAGAPQLTARSPEAFESAKGTLRLLGIDLEEKDDEDDEGDHWKFDGGAA